RCAVPRGSPAGVNSIARVEVVPSSRTRISRSLISSPPPPACGRRSGGWGYRHTDPPPAPPASGRGDLRPSADHSPRMAMPPQPWPTGDVEALEPLVRRVLAPNASPFTHTGTQTYLVGGPE